MPLVAGRGSEFQGISPMPCATQQYPAQPQGYVEPDPEGLSGSSLRYYNAC